MVLKILYAVGSSILPTEYIPHVLVAIIGVVTTYAFAQGRYTTRERDLHGRTILITGAFTPNGLTLLNTLAQRGAHVIALTPEPPDTGVSATLVSLLRSTTSNENIYAEQCDLDSPASIRSFCEKYHKSQQRLDSVIFAHEYAPIGTVFSGRKDVAVEKERQAASCATFLVVTLLLPLLLTAPVERDIRLITLVNPFYAAATRTFSASPSSSSLFLSEGRRALRTAIFMRHLQRVLDALPSGSQVPRTDVNAQSIPVVSDKVQRSNIVAVSVSPGISRTDVIAPLLAADASRGRVSWVGMILYVALNPLLRILTKSPTSALQSTLHSLFLPTPFKSLKGSPNDPKKRAPEEVLKPGALYAECAVVPVPVRVRPPADPTPAAAAQEKPEEGGKEDTNAAGAGVARPDDGELGGVALGMQVWDGYERELKVWESAEGAIREGAETEEERQAGSTTSNQS